MRPLRLLYLVHQYFPRHVGGTEVYTRGLVRRAAAAGHEPRVVTYHESPSGDRADHGAQRTEHEGVPVVEIHDNLSVAPQPARAEYANAFTAAAVRAEGASFRPHVVHVVHAMKLGAAAVTACADLGFPIVATFTDFWAVCPRHTLVRWDGALCRGRGHPLGCIRCLHATHGFVDAPLVRLPDWRMLPRAYLRLVTEGADGELGAIARRSGAVRRAFLAARRLFATSRFLRRMLVRNGFPARRVEVMETGLDLALAPHVPRPADAPVRLVFVGSLVPWKGAHVLLEALAAVPQARLDVRLHGAFGGDAAYEEHVRALAARDARVRLAGTFPPERFAEVLAACDVLAAPALWWENEPLVVKAALRMGVPVLASRIGTLGEMLADRGGHRLLAAGDVAEWAAALQSVAAAPPAPLAPAPVKTMDENAAELLRVYADVAGARVGGPAGRRVDGPS